MLSNFFIALCPPCCFHLILSSPMENHRRSNMPCMCTQRQYTRAVVRRRRRRSRGGRMLQCPLGLTGVQGIRCMRTTGLALFAECRIHSAKALLHSAKGLSSVALGKPHSVKKVTAKAPLPSVKKHSANFSKPD